METKHKTFAPAKEDTNRKLFAIDAVNRGRQIELDFARGLAVLFMVLIHTQEYFMTELAKLSVPAQVIDFLGGVPAAPVFMFLMGIGIMYSRRSTPKEMFIRGLGLFALGYLLSFLRGSLPSLFSALYLGYDWTAMVNMAIQQFSYIDIFQFSGLAMMSFAIFKALKLKPHMALVLAVIFAGINWAVTDYLGILVAANFLTVGLTGLLWGSSHIAFFPYLTWIVYPLVGYYFGSLLLRCTNKDLFYGIWALVGAVVYYGGYWLLYEILDWPILLDSATSYYHHQGIDNLLALGFVVLMLSALHFINRLLPFIATGLVGKALIRWSADVSEIYFVHWVIIGWLVPVISYNTQPLFNYFIVVVVVFAATRGYRAFAQLKGNVKI